MALVVLLCLTLLMVSSTSTDEGRSVRWTAKGWLDRGWAPAKRFLEPLWGLMGTRANDPWRYAMKFKRRSGMERASTPVIPEQFDARLQWPYCPTIGEVFEQGKCASCWAVVPTDVMSDRICIHSRGREIVRLSAGNLLSCCKVCGKGCKGGFPGGAWMYWKRNGIVTGAQHSSDYGCQRYQFFPCYQPRGANTGSSWNKCPQGDNTALKCRKTCQSSYKQRSYEEDLYYAKSVYRIPNDAQAIQLEIMENGPVQANLRIYEDFLHHRSGIYRHMTGKGLEYHAVKIIGWGVDENDGTPYWTCINPWTKRWGDGGFFKILRGSNHAEIEGHIMAGIPLLDSEDDTTTAALPHEWANETSWADEQSNMIEDEDLLVHHH